MAVTRIWDADNNTWRLVGGTVVEEPVSGLYLPLSGGTLTGPLYLATNPTSPTQAATKQYVDDNAGGGGGGGIPTGAFLPFGGSVAPSGFLLCDGALVLRADYPTLFTVIGTAYGAGDGTTTFGLPDLRGRFPLGKATTGTGSVLGQAGGSLNHVHGGPSHSHTGPSHTHTGPSHTHTGGLHGHNMPDTENSGGGTTGAGGAHDHTVPSQTSSSDGHAHTFSDSGSDSFSTGGASSVVGSLGIGGGSTTSAASTGHSHSGTASVSISGTTSSDSHSHTRAAIDTSSVGNHAHAGTVHAHAIPNAIQAGGVQTEAAGNGATGSAGTGATGAGGTGDTGTANPPYQVVNYIIKT